MPTIENIIEETIELGDQARIAKVDIAHAFRNLRVDPQDCLKLGYMWEGKYYLDVSLAFGLVHGTANFSRLSDSVRFIMNQNGYKVFNYIDDFLIVSSEDKATSAYEFLIKILNELGLPINNSKLVPPSRRVTCMGINIDLDNNTPSIYSDKLEEILQFCISFSKLTKVSKTKFQSLCGKLLYIQRCVRAARIFLNRMLSLLRNSTSKKHTFLNQDFHKDLNWFIAFLNKFNGVNYITKLDDKCDSILHVDACLTGIGGITDYDIFAAPIPDIHKTELSIVHFEMLAIIMSFKLWASKWKNKTIQIHSDNMAVVSVTQTSKTRDPFLATCIRNLWLMTANNNINFTIRHIAGLENKMADTLSRIYSTSPPTDQIMEYLNRNFNHHDINSDHWILNTDI